MIDWRELGFAVAVIVILFTAAALLPGCAGHGFTGVCGIQPIGTSDGGVPYFSIHCEPQP